MIISEKELANINGGSKWVIGGVISVIVSFFIGTIDGYLRPLACNA